MGRMAVALVVMALPGCVLSEIEEPQSQEPTTAHIDGAEEVGETFCRRYYDCGCDPGFGPHRTVEECQLHVATEITRRFNQGADAELTYQGACLDDIVDYFEAAECADASEVALDAALRGAMDSMLACKPWSGGALEGENCSRLVTAKGDDCAEGLSCDADFDVCVPSTLSPEGAPCDGVSPPCEAELTCVATDDTGDVCARLPKLGEACNELPCDAGSWCDPDAGQCVSLPSVGEPCVDGGNAYEWGCYRGTICRQGMCELSPGESEPCDNGTCAPGLVCDKAQCVAAEPLVCDLETELP